MFYGCVGSSVGERVVVAALTATYIFGSSNNSSNQAFHRDINFSGTGVSQSKFSPHKACKIVLALMVNGEIRPKGSYTGGYHQADWEKDKWLTKEAENFPTYTRVYTVGKHTFVITTV